MHWHLVYGRAGSASLMSGADLATGFSLEGIVWAEPGCELRSWTDEERKGRKEKGREKKSLTLSPPLSPLAYNGRMRGGSKRAARCEETDME